MKEINYKLSDGTIQNIEVSEDFAIMYEQIELDTRRSNERYKWELRKNLTSLSYVEKVGWQLEDPKLNFVENNYQHEELYIAISKLTIQQQTLIKRIFYFGESQREVALDLGIDPTSVRDRLKTIYVKLKKILN